MNCRFTVLMATILASLLSVRCAPAPQAPPAPTLPLTEEVREELLAAREAAWRAFFQNDPAALEAILGQEVIAIQQSSEEWERRPRLLDLARAISKNGVRILRLEFPHTEIQLFGDTAILYYTYIFETGSNGRSATDAGRGTEVFVQRNGRWVDVGWHLDNGAFVRQGGQWVRTGGRIPGQAGGRETYTDPCRGPAERSCGHGRSGRASQVERALHRCGQALTPNGSSRCWRMTFGVHCRTAPASINGIADTAQTASTPGSVARPA